MPFRYYYSAMTREEQAVYLPLSAGLAAYAPVIRVPRLPIAALSDVLSRVRLDDPRLCFVKNVSYRSYRGADHVEVVPEYAFPPVKMKTLLAQIDARCAKVSAPMKQLGTAAEKERAVHDWLVDSVRYDKLYKNYAHEVIGPLTHGVGVCEGIAKTAKLLYDALGIESIVVLSEPELREDGMEGFRHAWNLVRTARGWVHVDATFDNSLTCCGRRRYDEYGLSDREVSVNHRPSVYPLPPCPQGLSYYASAGCAVASAEALAAYLKKTGKRGTAVFLFQWTAADFPEELIARVCADFAAAKGKAARLHFHPERKVALLTLSDPAQDAGGIDEQHPD